MDAPNQNPTNTIWVNPEIIDSGQVKLDDVKLVVYALIRAGIRIKGIGPPVKNIAWRNNPGRVIWTGTDPTLESEPALTVQQVHDATDFRDEH
jgi:hypothetical protein